MSHCVYLFVFKCRESDKKKLTVATLTEKQLKKDTQDREKNMEVLRQQSIAKQHVLQSVKSLAPCF